MKSNFRNRLIEYRIGDVRDINSMRGFQKCRLYFSCCCSKACPPEFFPVEAIKTNILGTDNVLNLAEEFNVKKVILLSTDKACYPINVMGSTKMLMEKLMHSRAKFKGNSTIITTVRYGNVMFSRGSVLPLFFQQIFIKNGRDLTITDKKMTRFLMSLKNAIDLVIYAIKHGGNGDLFIHKAKVANIYDLARACIKITNSQKIKLKLLG